MHPIQQRRKASEQNAFFAQEWRSSQCLSAVKTSGRTFGYLKTRVPDEYWNGYPGTRFSNYFADSTLMQWYNDPTVTVGRRGWGSLINTLLHVFGIVYQWQKNLKIGQCLMNLRQTQWSTFWLTVYIQLKRHISQGSAVTDLRQCGRFSLISASPQLESLHTTTKDLLKLSDISRTYHKQGPN